MLSPEEIHAYVNTMTGTLPGLQAGQLRAMGFRIEESIPDCAVLVDGAFVAQPTITDPDGTIRIPITLQDAKFRWIETKIEVRAHEDAR